MSKKSRARAATRAGPKVTSGASLPQNPGSRFAHGNIFLAAGFLVVATLAAYYNSFSVPFLFDDTPGIKENATIRHLWPVWQALIPPHGPHDGGLPVAGRPMVNLSLALNYAFGGLAPQSYHALNLAIHILAGLALFGVVRRTLLQPRLRERFRADAWWLALAVAALWVLHPLQTESVTYIVQRAESLMGLFYLLTLYCFIRSTERRQESADRYQVTSVRCQEKKSGFQPLASTLWPLASIFACLLGMATKEVLVSAPLIVLLYDRTFVAGTFREAWRKRWRFYAGLAGTWLLLGCLVAGTHGRGGSAGFGTHVTWWSYALTQFRAIVHYLQLALWPAPLVFDYGTNLATRWVEIVPYALIVLLLVIGTAFALWRRPMIGFAGCWFFAILAPSSSIVPVVTQTMAEHRMYLALAAIVPLVVLGLYRLLGRGSALIFLALAVALGCVTARRNEDYRSPLAIWSDTVAKCPDNVRAHYILGDNLRLLGRSQEAITEFQTALQIEPRYAQAHNSLGNLLEKIPGQLPKAIAEYKEAIRLQPDLAVAHYNLALAIENIPGRLPEALSEYETALRIKPDFPEAQVDLGILLENIPGRLPDAISAYEAAIRSRPDLVAAHYNLAGLLANLPGRLPEAISEYETVLGLEPGLAKAHTSLGVALANSGKTEEGIAHLEAAIRIQPDDVDAYTALGTALVQAKRYPEAISRFQQVLKIQPDNVYAYNNLGTALLRVGRFPEATDQFNAALKIDPDFSAARLNLGFALSQMNRVPEAIQQLEAVLRTNANDATAAAARKLLSQLRTASNPAH
jgi:tetratricopeptide (TPR) repeat protein